MAPKIYIVNSQSQADYKVYYVNSPSQQKNHQLIEGGKLVQHQSQADLNLFIVKHPSQANILIMPKNFPK